MKLKDKVKNYGFWVSIISEIIILVQLFGLRIDVPILKEVLLTICSLMVTLGIISNPEKGKGFIDKNQDKK